jgi:hypothetical protein
MLDITKVGGGEFYVANGISTNSKWQFAPLFAES